mmetsp:Transcript_29014/g.67536  ORF Transcript_29014/g.67536 Transcript_29014/m.67536 type:complete len:231 (+) Transcript_29014:175-867(+)
MVSATVGCGGFHRLVQSLLLIAAVQKIQCQIRLQMRCQPLNARSMLFGVPRRHEMEDVSAGVLIHVHVCHSICTLFHQQLHSCQVATSACPHQWSATVCRPALQLCAADPHKQVANLAVPCSCGKVQRSSTFCAFCLAALLDSFACWVLAFNTGRCGMQGSRGITHAAHRQQEAQHPRVTFPRGVHRRSPASRADIVDASSVASEGEPHIIEITGPCCLPGRDVVLSDEV